MDEQAKAVIDELRAANRLDSMQPRDVAALVCMRTTAVVMERLMPHCKSIRMQSLAPVQAALILLAMRHIRMVVPSEIVEHDDARGVLAVYEPDGPMAGTYARITDHVIAHWSLDVAGCVDSKWRRELFVALRDLAPRVCETEDPNLVFLGNTIFNYATKERIPFSPEYVRLHKHRVNLPETEPSMPTHVLPDGSVLTLRELLESWTPYDGGIELLVKLYGAALRNYHNWRVMVTLHNTKGSNGKSTYLDSLRRAVGGDAVVVKSSIKSLCERFGASGLVGSSLIVVSESSAGDYITTNETAKCIISHDVIEVENKGRDSFSYTPHALIVCAANDLPRSKDKGSAWVNRNIFVPFMGSFDARNEDPSIKREWVVSDEFCEYMAYWALVEMPHYDVLPEPNEAKKLKGEYIELNDSVVEFWNTFSPMFVRDFVSFDLMYGLYKRWMADTHKGATLTVLKTFSNHIREVAEQGGEWCMPLDKNGRGLKFTLGQWVADLVLLPPEVLVPYLRYDRDGIPVTKDAFNEESQYVYSPLITKQRKRGLVRRSVYEYCEKHSTTPKKLDDKHMYGHVRKSLGVHIEGVEDLEGLKGWHYQADNEEVDSE